MDSPPLFKVRRSLMHPSKIQNLIVLVAMLALSLWAITTAANFIIEYNWWKEVGQVGTWISMLWYSIVPFVAGALVAFIAFGWLMRGAALRRRPPTGFPPVLPVGSSRVRRSGAMVRLGVD